jgi:hypothetical protein
MKLQLPTVTLLIVDCVNADMAKKVVDICKSKVDFGDIKLLTHLPIDSEYKVEIVPLKTLVAYSIFMLTKCHEYTNTSHVLVVQLDGFILNPESFNYDWLSLDYISPLFVQYDKVGSGGFSLRSKALMQNVSANMPKWDGTQRHADYIQSQLGYYEDGVICLSNKFKHFKFATPEQAAMFAQGGNKNPTYYRDRPFGFHRTHQVIDFTTGLVDSSDTERQMTNNYDNEINTLHKLL